MNVIRISLIPIIAVAATAALGQDRPLDTFNQQTKDVGQRMAQMGVSLSDVGRVEMLVQASNRFRVPPGKLSSPILGKESVLLFDPALEPTYFPATKTGCKVIDTNNAAYCAADNTIYYDPVFLAAVGKAVARVTGSSGDFGVLAIIAHELGHAIAFRKYPDDRFGLASTYSGESYADCAAGALTADAQQAKIWPAGAERGPCGTGTVIGRKVLARWSRHPRRARREF